MMLCANYKTAQKMKLPIKQKQKQKNTLIGCLYAVAKYDALRKLQDCAKDEASHKTKTKTKKHFDLLPLRSSKVLCFAQTTRLRKR